MRQIGHYADIPVPVFKRTIEHYGGDVQVGQRGDLHITLGRLSRLAVTEDGVVIGSACYFICRDLGLEIIAFCQKAIEIQATMAITPS